MYSISGVGGQHSCTVSVGLGGNIHVQYQWGWGGNIHVQYQWDGGGGATFMYSMGAIYVNIYVKYWGVMSTFM